jgi:glycosyltransferase involved in cell wall biosynthesis
LSGLVEHGHDVTWYAARHSGKLAEEWNGIRMAYGQPGFAVYASGHRWLRRNGHRYDLVIDQVNSLGFCAPLTGLPVACLIHQLADDVWDMEVPWPFNLVGRATEKRVLGCYRETPFMTMCQSTVDEMHEWGWSGRGYVTPTGIDRTYQVEKAPQPTLSFLARFGAKAKRLDHAVAIHERVRTIYPDCELWVIGRGTPPAWLRRHRGVKVFCDVDDSVRDELLGSAWCCIATSVREGWGRMVTESGAAGTPTVGYDVPGLRDAIIDGETGLVTKPDIEDAARAVTELFGQPLRLAQLGAAARAATARVTWRHSVDEFEAAIDDIMERNHRGRSAGSNGHVTFDSSSGCSQTA